MSDIKIYISEINEIDKELKILQDKSKKLRVHKKKLEEKVQKYMEETNRPGFRFGRTAVIMEKAQRRKPKGKKQKIEDVEKLLKSAGIYNEGLARRIIGETQGEQVEQNRVKIIGNDRR